MNLSDYIEYDAIGLAQLISGGQVSAHEVQQVARQVIEAVTRHSWIQYNLNTLM